MKELSRKQRKNEKRVKRAVTAVVLLMFLALVGGLAARYVTENYSRAEMLSSDFHISSNYLEEQEEGQVAAEYNVSVGNPPSIEILLFNYEKENVAQLAGTDIKYTITTSSNDWSLEVKNGTAAVKAENGEYTLSQSATRTNHQLILTYTGAEELIDPLDVTVTTTAPYAKTLSATFVVSKQSEAEYQVIDEGDYRVVTIYTNDYAGDLKIKWVDAYSPDNTNPLMRDWMDSDRKNGKYLSGLEANTTYELIFVEHKAVTGGEQKEPAPVSNKLIEIN